jgi:PAS domain S-box-containing protein
MSRKPTSPKKLPKLQRPRNKSSAATASPPPTRFANGEPFRSLVQNLGVGVAVVSLNGDILFANHRFAETIGLSRDAEIVGSNLRSFFSRSSLPDLESALSHCCQDRMEGEMSVDAGGRERVVHLAFEQLPDDSEPLISLLATEVTELVEKRKALVESKASVYSLSARILQLQDEERRRISRDLHDVVGQEIAVLAMSLSHLASSTAAGFPEAHRGLTESIAQVHRIEEGVRTLSYLLHPPLLDELGLSSALHWYVDGFAKRSGILVEKTISSDSARFGLDAETALFRVVQESLANVLRHSGSRNARVRFWIENGAAQVSIEDEGKGIPPQKLSAANGATGILGVGISGMRQRLEQLGGSLTIRPRRPGTLVVAAVPLTAETQVPAPATLQAGSEPDSPLLASEASTSAFDSGANRQDRRKRILIADDHEVTRQGIRTLLASERDLEICGEACDGLEAVQKTEELQPDIVLMDLAMPRLNGIAAAHQIKRMRAKPKILVFTSHAHSGLDGVVRGAGLDGYVLKSDGNRDLVRAVRAVLGGASFYRSVARGHAAS